MLPEQNSVNEMANKYPGYTYYIDRNMKIISGFIDGKDEYIKRILIDRFPNDSILEVSTGLNHSKINFGDVSGIAKSTEQQLNVPFLSLSGFGIQVETRLTSNDIAISTGNDRSSYSGYLDIRFTYKN